MSDPPLVFKASVAGKNGRVDVVQGDKQYKTGDYLLTSDGGETFWIVSVKKKEATRFTTEKLRKEGSKEKFNLSDISLSPPAASGAGEAVGGVVTNQFRTARDYRIVARELFFSVNIAVSETWDFQIARDAANLPSFNPVISLLALQNSAVLFKHDAFATGGYRNTVPKGFALRVVAEGVSTEGRKKEREVSVITCDTPVAAPQPPSLFALGEGIRRKE